MCGIIAYLGHRTAKNILIEGLKILQNRGYDSAGIVTINQKGELEISKEISQETTSDAIDRLEQKLNRHDEKSTIGAGHSRWATTGNISIINSHPHNDISGRFSLVHNGVIENYISIKNFLFTNNIQCISDTDTEVIVQLIYYYSLTNPTEKAIELALNDLEGTWGLVILDKENPNKLFVARHGSPILIGLGQGEIFVASEMAAFQKYTNRYISLNNNEIVTVTKNGNNVDLNIVIDNRIKELEKEEILTDPSPYPHWTLREISLQPETINAALNNGARIKDNQVILGGLERNKERLLSIRNLIIVGCGTSYHAGLYASNIFRQISGFDTVQVVDASEFDNSYLNDNNIGILALSQSGETKDVMRCLENINNNNIVTFSVINRVGSQIARTTNCGVYLNAGREVGVASTKAFTSQVTVLTMIGVWFGSHRSVNDDNIINNIKQLSTLYSELLSNIKFTDEAANYLQNKQSCFVLGKGLASYIALEGALKIKEIGYIHAEGYPGGSLKHGPFALIEKGTPIIIILLNDNDKNYMESTISEVKARGAYTIVITNIKEYNGGDINIEIPENGILSALMAVVPLQLIAYKLSVNKGINPDKPRHLAKTVTVI